jgi:CHAT domain-containing protein/tetratricopeptide (TPR) repeat protein
MTPSLFYRSTGPIALLVLSSVSLAPACPSTSTLSTHQRLLSSTNRRDDALARAMGYRKGRGKFRAALSEMDQDSNRATAEKLVADAERLGAENTEGARAQALEKLQQALPLWQAAADLKGEAETLNSIAEIYEFNGDSKKALDAGERALQLFQLIDDRPGEAKSLNTIAEVKLDNGEVTIAVEYFRRALDIWQQVSDQKQEAATLNNLGMAYDELGDPRTAMECLTRSLALRRATGDQLGEATTLSNIGSVHDSLGELQSALDYYTRALPLFRAQKNLRREALILNNIGYIWSRLGELQNALEYYSQALPIRRTVGDRRGEAISLSNVGSTYYKLGEDQQALEYYSQSLAFFRALQDKAGEARTLGNIARVYVRTGEAAQTLELYSQILAVERARKDKRSEGSTLRELGFVHYSLKNYTQALEYMEQALSIARTVESRSDEAGALQKLGVVYAAMGRLEESAEAYRQALEMYRQMGSREKEAMTLYGSASTELKRGNLQMAREQIASAIDLAESLRGKFTSEELRVSLLAEKAKHYETYVEVLMRLHEQEPAGDYDALALQIHELARARGLLDLLTETRADIRQGGDPLLLARERKLEQQLDEKERYRMSLLRTEGKEKQLAEVERELNALLTQYRNTQAEIRLKSPQYAALTQPRPLDLKEIQTRVLDSDTVLLEYALGDERSYLWFVTPNSLATFVLPGRAEIESQARRLYELLSTNTKAVAARARSEVFPRSVPSETEYREAAIALGNLLLGPVADRLGQKRLLIVSDGALQYVPFGALHEPFGLSKTSIVSGGTALPKTYSPVILEHEVITMPSASALAALRSEAKGHKRATKMLAVLADPVYRRDDPRLTSSKAFRRKPMGTPDPKPSGDVESEIQRSSRDSGLGDFTRLRFSRQEAESITSLLPRKEELLALDFAASRAMAQSPELSDYRIVHFATHGFLNSKHPELSGLVFSLVDEEGRPQDGFLRFHQIFNLKLNADLVVLSGCQTALGKEIDGEGLMGLTRGFMYAGSPRVVASLWNVNDRATSELMKRFYQAMLIEKKRPAAALRVAQMSLLADKGWSSPYYWAGFTIQGEWQ